MIEKNIKEMLWVSLMEFYGVTIFPDMTGPISLNYINGDRVTYGARVFDIKGKGCKEIKDMLVSEYGLIHESEVFDIASFTPKWPYKKYYAFYELDEKKQTLRCAIGDYI